MKKTEMTKIDAYYCDLCGKEIDADFKEGYEVNVNLHLHHKCEERLPPWARGEDNILWFFDAVKESGIKVGVTIENFMPEDPLMNEDFLLFINSREDGSWICKCNNLQAIAEVYNEIDHDARWIEGVWHKGLFRKVRFKVTAEVEGL